ncbi:MAG: segregation/condensation protein A [Deltaproteobacteria bacterium]|nr:segregation/condensation protein A [Deltaproteobacteria bacterium]
MGQNRLAYGSALKERMEKTMTNRAGMEQLNAVFSPSDLSISSDRSSLDDFRINLPNFDGPLDLLLHLIRREQIDIYDIPLTKVCECYLQYLNRISELNISVAGEFTVMAATLMHLKSVMLLPQESDGAPEEDPRLPLVAQLLEYERFKKAAEQLDGRNWLNRDLFVRPLSALPSLAPDESAVDAPVEPIDTFELLLCLKVAMDRTTRRTLEISAESTSIKEKVAAITAYLEQNGIIDFSAFMSPDSKNRRQEMVVGFLAMLELARLKFVEIFQPEIFGPIQLRSIRSLRELDLGLLEQY